MLSIEGTDYWCFTYRNLQYKTNGQGTFLSEMYAQSPGIKNI